MLYCFCLCLHLNEAVCYAHSTYGSLVMEPDYDKYNNCCRSFYIYLINKLILDRHLRELSIIAMKTEESALTLTH